MTLAVHFTEESPTIIETEGPVGVAEEAPDEKPAEAEEEAEQGTFLPEYPFVSVH